MPGRPSLARGGALARAASQMPQPPLRQRRRLGAKRRVLLLRGRAGFRSAGGLCGPQLAAPA